MISRRTRPWPTIKAALTPIPCASYVARCSESGQGPPAVGVQDDGRDPLRKNRRRCLELLAQEPPGGVRVYVDEAGRNVESSGVDDGVGRPIVEPSRPNDASVPDPDVRRVPRVACPVENAAVLNENVVGIGASAQRGQQESEPKDRKAHRAQAYHRFQAMNEDIALIPHACHYAPCGTANAGRARSPAGRPSLDPQEARP